MLKSLSPEEIQQYRDGEGMGMAKAAELNHYPGPKHALQVGTDINLSNDQQAKAQQFHNPPNPESFKLSLTSCT